MVGCEGFSHCRAADLTIGSFDVHLSYLSTSLKSRWQEYQLRYRAFAEEYGWEDVNVERIEYDEYDEFSCSALLTRLGTNEAVACQRLVLPDLLPRGMHTNVEREYRAPDCASVVDFDRPLRASWAEASRLTIAPPYRYGAEFGSLGAMTAVTYATLAIAIALGRTTLYTLSDVRTARLTRRIGVTMHQVGSVVEFHGQRATFRIDIDEVLGSLPDRWRPAVSRITVAARALAGRCVECPDAA